MSNKPLIGASALGTAALLLCGCGGGSGSAMSPAPVMPASQVQQIDTHQLLAVAKVTTETGDPKPVGNKVLVVAPADDETSDPLPVG